MSTYSGSLGRRKLRMLCFQSCSISRIPRIPKRDVVFFLPSRDRFPLTRGFCRRQQKLLQLRKQESRRGAARRLESVNVSAVPLHRQRRRDIAAVMSQTDCCCCCISLCDLDPCAGRALSRNIGRVRDGPSIEARVPAGEKILSTEENEWGNGNPSGERLGL